MPYFKWVGVDISATIKKGKMAAYSSTELSELLLRRGISLLYCKVQYIPLFLWTINCATKYQLFSRIAQLLRAGILLPEAFLLSAQQSSNPILYEILFACAMDIKNGTSFSAVVVKHKSLFDSITTTMFTVGDESGNLVDAFESASQYYVMNYAFQKNIRSAIAMPLLTFIFFISISSFIFVFIIPRFADMFCSLHHQLPSLTVYMIGISDFIRSQAMLGFCCVVVAIVITVCYYFKTRRRLWKDKIMMKMPFVGVLIVYHQLGQLLSVLSLLIKRGIPLAQALEVVKASLGNLVIKNLMDDLCSDIQSGRLLSSAMSATSSFFTPEVIALVNVGEESGALGDSLCVAAEIYQGMLSQSLKRFVFCIQPCMIIILGFLITLLIFAVYLPIMELSRAL